MIEVTMSLEDSIKKFKGKKPSQLIVETNINKPL